MSRDPACFIPDKSFDSRVSDALSHDSEVLDYLGGTEGAKRGPNQRRGQALSRRFGNIVINCHANEEQWTKTLVEQRQIFLLCLLLHILHEHASTLCIMKRDSREY